MTIREMLEAVQGYKKHFEKIDAETAHEEECNCGRTWDYWGFKKGDIYRPFCVCEHCDIAEEF